MFDKGSTS